MKVLTIRNLRLIIDNEGTDPVEEARQVVRDVNRVLGRRMYGDAVLDFDPGTGADIEAEFTEAEEEEC